MASVDGRGHEAIPARELESAATCGSWAASVRAAELDHDVADGRRHAVDAGLEGGAPGRRGAAGWLAVTRSKPGACPTRTSPASRSDRVRRFDALAVGRRHLCEVPEALGLAHAWAPAAGSRWSSARSPTGRSSLPPRSQSESCWSRPAGRTRSRRVSALENGDGFCTSSIVIVIASPAGTANRTYTSTTLCPTPPGLPGSSPGSPSATRRRPGSGSSCRSRTRSRPRCQPDEPALSAGVATSSRVRLRPPADAVKQTKSYSSRRRWRLSQRSCPLSLLSSSLS